MEGRAQCQLHLVGEGRRLGAKGWGGGAVQSLQESLSSTPTETLKLTPACLSPSPLLAAGTHP